MQPTRIGLVAIVATFVVVLASPVSFAQNAYPTKTVRIVVPYPAGGGTDVLGRSRPG
jgi:tripartite-type tricarboxylate transporter receptor subunit TctC